MDATKLRRVFSCPLIDKFGAGGCGAVLSKHVPSPLLRLSVAILAAAAAAMVDCGVIGLVLHDGERETFWQDLPS